MDDDTFLRTFMRGWPVEERFGHYEHLRAAWLVIERHDPELAAEIVGDRLRHMAVAQRKAPLYNETMTRFWIRLIAHVPLKHWTRTAMFGPEGRAGWVEPDQAPLPF